MAITYDTVTDSSAAQSEPGSNSRTPTSSAALIRNEPVRVVARNIVAFVRMAAKKD